MNKVMLKQQTNKQEEKDKKEKKKQEPIKITKEIIRHRLITHFQNHIGELNKTTAEEIFQIVIGINSYMVNSFARFYWWKQIENIIRELRRKDIVFIIKKKGLYFVLKEQDEADYYKNLCDKAINNMEKAKDRADSWVENNKWVDFEASKKEDFITPQPQEKTITEKVNDSISQASRKVIKLYKEIGENENENKN